MQRMSKMRWAELQVFASYTLSGKSVQPDELSCVGESKHIEEPRGVENSGRNQVHPCYSVVGKRLGLGQELSNLCQSQWAHLGNKPGCLPGLCRADDFR